MIYNMIDTDELVSSLVEPTLNRNVLNNLILESAYNSNNHDIKLISPVPKGFQIWHSNWVRLATNGTNL